MKTHRFFSEHDSGIKLKLLKYFKKPNASTCTTTTTASNEARIDEGWFVSSCSSLVTHHKLDFLSLLPHELSCLVLSFCSEKTILECQQVCKYWYALCKDNILWKQLYMNHHGTIYYPSDCTAVQYKSLYERKSKLLKRWKYGTDVQLQTIMGHTDSIYCVQFDATKIITGSRDKTIKFWNPVSAVCTRTLVGHRASVLCLQYDDNILVSGSSDHTVLVWSMETYKIMHTLRGHSSGVLDVCFDKKHIISCSKDATIRVWSRDGVWIKTLTGHRGPVNAIQFLDNRLVSASGDTVIKLWDITTGACLRDFIGHAHGLACIRFDGKKIVSGSNDNKIKVWNAGTYYKQRID